MGSNPFSFIAPIVIVLTLAEIAVCRVWKKDYISFQDSIASLGTQIVNQPVNLFVAWLVTLGYGWIWNHLPHAPERHGFWAQVVLLFAIDFLFYWFHRLGHRTNLFWAAHGLHHTAEEMNLAVALRSTITQRLFSYIFYWPLLFFGFNPTMIYAMSGLNLLLGYWHHTRLIPKMGWFELLFNSPSHHRVHHGVNPQYIDKNYGEVLIIWDRVFGTFEEEFEPVVFGSSSPPRTWSPLKLNLLPWIYIRDAIRATSSWREKILLPFMPPAWVPSTIEPKFVELCEKKQMPWDHYEKYVSPMLAGAKTYIIPQAIVALLFMMIAVTPQGGMKPFEVIVTSVNLWWMAINWSEILEGRTRVWASEMCRTIGFLLCVSFGFSHYRELFMILNFAGLLGLTFRALSRSGRFRFGLARRTYD